MKRTTGFAVLAVILVTVLVAGSAAAAAPQTNSSDAEQDRTQERDREKARDRAQVKEMIKAAVNRAAALEGLKKYLSEHPDSVHALKELARMHEDAGDTAQTLEALQKAIEIDPRNRNLYTNMYRVYTQKGDRSLKVFVNGKKPSFDVPPVIKDGRTLVPVRALVEALGATVEWQAETRTVVISKGDTVVRLQLETRTALVNEQPVELDVPPKSINGRTVIPLRFIAQALGCEVDFDNDSGTVVVGDQPLEEYPDDPAQDQEEPPAQAPSGSGTT
ncbi:MAG: hypothetical protein HPY55_00830 [Firmicutes bacterium]|nr:hypothetical protein [Bacillota bacterium]